MIPNRRFPMMPTEAIFRRFGLRRSLLSFALLSFLWCPHAQAMNEIKVGLVVSNGSKIETNCVSVQGSHPTGLSLLKASGLRVGISLTGAVCRIGNVGCPTDNCFCKCTGDPCMYWAFYAMDSNSVDWKYANSGPGSVQVKNGSVHLWSWTQQESIMPNGMTSKLPSVAFHDICKAP